VLVSGYEKSSLGFTINHMSPSPSGPYKSRMVRGVVQQVRRLLDRSQTTVRQVQVAASWSAQILLYPVYALFQTSRLIGKTLERSQDEARLRLELPDCYDIPLTVEPAPITAETPLQNVLQTLQGFDLPTNCVVQVAQAEAIRAIASQVDCHDLVLVTNTNRLLTLPDPQQQLWLKQRLIYEIALVNQQQRTRSLPWQPVIRALQGISTAIRRRFAPLPNPPAATLVSPALSAVSDADLRVDSSIKRSLVAVRQWLATTEVAMVPVTASARSLAAAHPAPLKLAKIQIRGVASQLQDRQLVLVSRTNDVVHILTAEQAALLHQRIAWETSHYQRYVKLQAEVAATLSPLRPPVPDRVLLPPIRAFQRVMAWMQSGPVALATNLFQEASWFSPALSAADTQVPPQLPPNAREGVLARAVRRLPPRSPVPHPAALSTMQPVDLSLERDRALSANAASSLLTNPTHDPIELSNDTRSREYIDTDVTWVGYEQSWLERIMHWFDQVFLWLEDTLSQLWKSVIRK
jgi:hypothetical protein